MTGQVAHHRGEPTGALIPDDAPPPGLVRLLEAHGSLSSLSGREREALGLMAEGRLLIIGS